MKNTFGNNISVTLFGESHGPAIGAVIDGLSPGIEVNCEYIKEKLSLRRPSGAISTARTEEDEFVIQSGVFDGKTTGTPICIIIPNKDTRSKDYAETRFIPRPSHADYAAFCKYGGFEDYRGGGHFSGRITAALVAVGAIVMSALEKKGIRIATHISRCAGIQDRGFKELSEDISFLASARFPVLDAEAAEKMQSAILAAKKDGDSVGGVLETVVTGVGAGFGEPWFDTVEGMLAHALFSIPAVKGVEFGAGFAIADMLGSQANDPFVSNGGEITTRTNNSGGINGGITNGMPILFKCAVRPTPTLSKEQNSVDMMSGENVTLKVTGRHDPCILHRARIVVDCVVAITLADIISGRLGTDWMR